MGSASYLLLGDSWALLSIPIKTENYDVIAIYFGSVTFLAKPGGENKLWLGRREFANSSELTAEGVITTRLRTAEIRREIKEDDAMG